jgi:hypothetical protein
MRYSKYRMHRLTGPLQKLDPQGCKKQHTSDVHSNIDSSNDFLKADNDCSSINPTLLQPASVNASDPLQGTPLHDYKQGLEQTDGLHFTDDENASIDRAIAQWFCSNDSGISAPRQSSNESHSSGFNSLSMHSAHLQEPLLCDWEMDPCSDGKVRGLYSQYFTSNQSNKVTEDIFIQNMRDRKTSDVVNITYDKLSNVDIENENLTFAVHQPASRPEIVTSEASMNEDACLKDLYIEDDKYPADKTLLNPQFFSAVDCNSTGAVKSFEADEATILSFAKLEASEMDKQEYPVQHSFKAITSSPFNNVTDDYKRMNDNVKGPPANESASLTQPYYTLEPQSISSSTEHDVLGATVTFDDHSEQAVGHALISTSAATVSSSACSTRRRKPKHVIADHEKEYVTAYTDDDVLCQRGGKANVHKGNKRYLEMKNRLHPSYINASCDKEKRRISQSLVDFVKESNGRFLQQDDFGWFVVSDERAREKCSQALRETLCTPELRVAKRLKYPKKKRKKHH